LASHLIENSISVIGVLERKLEKQKKRLTKKLLFFWLEIPIYT